MVVEMNFYIIFSSNSTLSRTFRVLEFVLVLCWYQDFQSSKCFSLAFSSAVILTKTKMLQNEVTRTNNRHFYIKWQDSVISPQLFRIALKLCTCMSTVDYTKAKISQLDIQKIFKFLKCECDFYFTE